MLVLTELYIGTKKLWLLIFEFALGTALYAASYIFQAYVVLPTSPDFFNLITQTFGYAFALLVHFFIVQVALAFYRQYLKLDKALAELDESKKELEAAYAVVAEVSVLEERQRIAKEIHDTAGHAVTTVIMQTEAAKLIIDKNPEQAKAKIVSANLQAKRAL
jgi:signal transduction histidine kinase